jgi:MFS family permease
MAWLGDFWGLERNVLVMTIAGTIQAIGVGLWSGYLPKYMGELGARAVMIGAFATLGALVGLVFPYFGGLLSDRLGRGRAMVLASTLAVGGHLVYIVAPSWWMLFPGSLLTSAGAYFAFMGSLALVGDALLALPCKM